MSSAGNVSDPADPKGIGMTWNLSFESVIGSPMVADSHHCPQCGQHCETAAAGFHQHQDMLEWFQDRDPELYNEYVEWLKEPPKGQNNECTCLPASDSMAS
mgnify:CR=1 FL=1